MTAPLPPRGDALRGDAPRDDALVIGLVNNMADAALDATERRFTSLLEAAAAPRRVSVQPFWFDSIPRSRAVKERFGPRYRSVRDLPKAGLDALIVTGAEPRAEDLIDEPFWPEMAQLVDWARTGVASTVWSCLAAHAAVLRLDHISRRPLLDKCSGVFECAKVQPHALLEGLPRRWRTPHSRCNGLDGLELERHGYRVLSSSPQIGPDIFVRRGASLSVFLQGHPEYGADALPREYLRDVGRFLKGEQADPPVLPHGCFTPAQSASLLALDAEAEDRPRPGLLDAYRSVIGPIAENAPWRRFATGLFGNWLRYLDVEATARSTAA